jgi:hypothetical protein
MSKFFLNNYAITNVANYNEFKNGLLELIRINKQPSHIFYKHESLYTLPILIDGLYTAGIGKDEQEIFRFLEHLTPCDIFIETENDANAFCNSAINGFLGINFNGLDITSVKQLKNNNGYKGWCLRFLKNLDYFLTKSNISPADKRIHLSDHHGKKELGELCDRLKNSDYVEEMQSTDWGGNEFIREVYENGVVEIVLHKTDRGYAINVKTTGKDLLETKAIAEILKKKYDS